MIALKRVFRKEELSEKKIVQLYKESKKYYQLRSKDLSMYWILLFQLRNYKRT